VAVPGQNDDDVGNNSILFKKVESKF